MPGRKRLKEPNAKHLAILKELEWGTRPATIAKVYNMSRQSVYSITKRWPGYVSKRKRKK